MVPFDINQHQIHHVHLIGIGGISMSAIAEILLEQGYHVSGSDIIESKITEKLRNHGAEIYIGHSKENIKNPGLIVYSAAIKETNPERLAARELNILQIDRAEMLGQIMKKYNKAIAVAGSHGKTTTTSLISVLLEYAGLDPTILVGGDLEEIGGNIKIGQSRHFITEACEYMEGFLKFFPFIGIILNIDKDHLDYFKNMNHIKSAFKKFAQLIPEKGFLIACKDDLNVSQICRDLKCNVITYGIHEKAQFMAKNIEYSSEGFPSFDVRLNGKPFGRFRLSIRGKHNIYNALASIAVCHVLGLQPEIIAKYIQLFKGIHRRFDLMGEIKGAKIIDDYAHHPAEIRATLDAAQQHPHKEIWCVFQPHTFSRTKALLDDFSMAFGKADHVIITDIYAAREPDNGEINSKRLAELISKNHSVNYMQDFETIAQYLYDRIQPGDLVITMGAGNVYKIGEILLDKKSSA